MVKQITFPVPNYLLKRFFSKINKGMVLDVGAGDGRNAFFLAQNNFKVQAIDIDRQNIEKIRNTSHQLRLSIVTSRIDLREFSFPKKYYSLILAIQSLSFLRKSEFQITVSKMKRALKPKGVIFISSFTVKDSSCQRFRQSLKEIEKDTFQTTNSGQCWQFLEKDELKGYFPKKEFDVLFYREKIIKDGPHQGVLHFHKHGIAQIIVKKK